MLYLLLSRFADQFQGFNLFRYITFRSGGAVVTALLISLVFGTSVIAWLRSMQGEGQPIRTDGPQGHLVRKKGTPTMGGFLILLALTISTLVWGDLGNAYVWIVIGMTVTFGLIGFLDDYRKLTRRSHHGVPGRVKLLLEILMAVGACIALAFLMRPPIANTIAIPFVKNIVLNVGWFFLPFGILVITGASNAVNLTDGLDGLAIGPSMIATGCFAFIAYAVGNANFANYLQLHHVPGADELTVFCGAMVGRGLAKSGRAGAGALAAGGADIVAWDDNPKARGALAAQLAVRDLATADWRNIAAVVLSPGIPHSFPEPHPAVTRARDAGAAIIGDLELLGRAQPEARYIGITGTNGKSTTTALIGHILAAAGQRVEVGGNLGTPALSLAPLGRDGSYVIEASSFQLELITTLAFDIALLLNITPDHLDRHGTMEGYVAAKRHIFARQNKAATAIVGVDDAICRDLCDELRRIGPARVVPISVLQPVSGGVYVDQGWLVDAMGGQPVRVLDLGLAERLPGAHNWQNAAAAYAAARVSGVDTAAATAAICSFRGLVEELREASSR